MKYLIIAFLLPIMGLGQIDIKKDNIKTESIGKVSPMGSFIAEIKMYTDNGDTSYAIIMRNHKYTSITDLWSVNFNGGKKDLEQIRITFMDAFKKETRENYKLNLKLGKDNIWLNNRKTMGSYYLSINKDGAYLDLSEKQVEKLFGK